jgi:hypothetical protein
MECERVRDRFSSFLENELNPLEERIVKEHLASCPDCQKDLQEFDKTIRWLHSVKEVKVPDGFLIEIYKKMEERKRKIPFFSIPLRLPVQAVAMVAIVFLVLYLTKIMPIEMSRQKDAEDSKPFVSAPLPSKKQVDQVVAQIERKKGRGVTQTPPEPSSLSRVSPSPSETEKMEAASAKREQVSPAAKPPREIVLRTPDREKTLSQLHDLLHQFGGKIVTTEGNIFLASLPAVTFSEFEEELLGLGSPEKADRKRVQKDVMGRLDVPGGAKQRAFEMKGKEGASPRGEMQGYLLVRILLLQE